MACECFPACFPRSELRIVRSKFPCWRLLFFFSSCLASFALSRHLGYCAFREATSSAGGTHPGKRKVVRKGLMKREVSDKDIKRSLTNRADSFEVGVCFINIPQVPLGICDFCKNICNMLVWTRR